MIYLDYAATTPMSEKALEIYQQVAKSYYGNPSSLHDIGSTAKNILEHCRQELATLIHAEEKGIIFTSGGTESNVLAIKTLLMAVPKTKKHIITTKMEHASLMNYLSHLDENHGYKISYLSVDRFGHIDLNELQSLIYDETALVSIQHANSEIGVIQEVNKIGEILHQHGVFFHSDCVQTFGKIPIDVKTMKIDSLSISSHKIYGPKGVGALYINPTITFDLYHTNSNQERGIRQGTVNVPGIAAFITAAQETCSMQEQEFERLTELRKFFIEQVNTLDLNVDVFHHPTHQLPHVIGMVLGKIQGDYAMLEFNRKGVAVSTGSACSVGQQQPSKTILAIKKSETVAKQFIRLSLGKETTKKEIEKVAKICDDIITNY